MNVIAPQLEVVGEAHAVSLAPNDAPSMQAMQRIGKDFQEFDSNSSAMIVLEGDQPLGDDAHKYYDGLIDKLEADKKHVEHIQDFWGDPLTAVGCAERRRQGRLRPGLPGGQPGRDPGQRVRRKPSATSSPDSRHRRASRPTSPAPPPLTNDQHHAGDKSIKLITAITICVIFVMLLFVYRSIVTVLLVLVMMFIELAAARGIVAALGYYDLIGLSTFAVNLLTTLAIAAGTDYAIFLVGRYHEARENGEDRETAFYTMYHGTAHVILGSGLTIAGATFCLHFTRLPYFQTLGIPLAIGMLVAVVGGADHGARPADHLQSVRPVRSEAGDAGLAAGARSAPPWCAGPVRSWSRRSRWRWSACWRCRLQAELQRPQLPARRHPGQLRATRPPTGTSRRPG